VVRIGHLPFAALVWAALAAPALAGEGMRITAKEIVTWAEGGERVFVLEKDAGIEAPGGSLAADAMVVRFDEKAAASGGTIEIRVYSEKAGVGSVTVLTGSGELAVDDTALRSSNAPIESELVARADKAFLAEAGSRTADAAAAPDAKGAGSEGTGHTAAASGTAQAGAAGKPETGDSTAAGAGDKETKAEIIPGMRLPEGESIITYSPIDSDYYDSEMEKIGNATRIVITGGIEIALGEYKMRAGNMVIYAIESDEGKVSEVQIYAEENVRFITPSATLDADRLFYDSAGNSALLVSARLYAQLTREGLPLILRAERVRSYGGTLYKATEGYATTCEFGKPHYKLWAKSTSIIPVKHPDGTDSALVISRDNRFYAGGVPVLRWPRLSRDIKEIYTPLRRLSIDNSDSFGNCVYTTWSLFDFFGGETASSWAARMSKWSQLEGSVDYRSKRGTGAGLEFDYDRPEIRGAAEGYHIKDRGTDGNGFVPPSDDRGRLRWRQRTRYGQYQIDTELSYISDRGFLPEYYERETKEDKAPETYLYVKRPWEHAQAEFLYRARLNDFQTQTEYLPQGRLDFVGYPLWDGSVLYSSTTRAGNVRFSPDDAFRMPSRQTQRFDTLHSFEAPLPTSSGFTFTPFTRFRESYWDDAADGRHADRFAGSWGAKIAAPPVWRTYDVSSRLFNVNRIRHVVNFDVTYEDVYNSTRRPTELLPFDDVEFVGETKAATLALRQRFQTKRDAVAEGEAQRLVNLLTLDAEADYFPEPGDDNAGRAWSNVRANSRAAVTDDVSVILDGDYDTYQGRFDKAAAWLRVDHYPRTTFSLGNRYIRPVSSSVLTATVDHVITDRWDICLVSQYDFDHGQMLDERFVLRRRVHEFAIEFKVKYDKGRHDTTVGIDVYPLGIGGIRRF